MAEVANKEGTIQSPSYVWKFIMRTFVENKQLAATDHRTRERNDLSLADGEVASATGYLTVKGDAALIHVTLQVEQTSRAQRIVEDGIIMLFERIQILA